MNRVFLLGRLTRNPEIATTTSGKKCANFSLAVSRPYKNKDGTYDSDFFNCTAWGRSAEYAEKYLHKGLAVAMEGELRQDKWEDQEGKRREKVYVNIAKIHLLPGTRKPDGNGASPDAGEFPGAEAPSLELPMDAEEDNLPF